MCLKLSSYFLYGSSLGFSSAGFEHQLCFHLHAFVKLKYTLAQVSSLQMDKSQPFSFSLQGSWLNPGLFLLPISLCSLANSFAIFLETARPKTSQLWVHRSFMWRQNDTFCLVFMPLLTHPILPWLFFFS